jgi:Putative auto-transporter adhesin, head GIN domain
MRPLLISALLLAAALAGCVDVTAGAEQNRSGITRAIVGSGTITTQPRAVAGIHAVRIETGGRAVIERGEVESLTVTADDNIVPLISAEVRSGVLVLSSREANIAPKKLVFRITVKDVQHLDLVGSGVIDASRLEGRALVISLSGAGDIKAAGRIDDLTVSISGAGNCDTGRLVTKHANISVSGAGNVWVNATEALEARISGSSRIWYRGSPKLQTAVSGAGAIAQQRGA